MLQARGLKLQTMIILAAENENVLPNVGQLRSELINFQAEGEGVFFLVKENCDF